MAYHVTKKNIRQLQFLLTFNGNKVYNTTAVSTSI